MQYTYLGVRDVFMHCASYVDTNAFDHRRVGEMPKCFITTRDATEDGLGQTLMNYLSSAGIKFKARLATEFTPHVYQIEFELNQSQEQLAKVIYETVTQMGQDRKYLDWLNNILEMYNPTAVREREEKAQAEKNAIKQLQQMIQDYEGDIGSSDGGLWFYFYFDQVDIEKAQKLFEILDMPMEQHISHLDGIERTVLRYPGTMIPGYALDIMGKLREAINKRRDSGNNLKPEYMDELKSIVSGVSEYSGLLDREKKGVQFMFKHDLAQRGVALLRALGIKIHSTAMEKRPNGYTLCDCLYSENSEALIQVYQELRPVVQTQHQVENFEHGRNMVSKTEALTRLKALIQKVGRLSRSEESKPENIGKLLYCMYFDKNVLDKAQKLLKVLGMTTTPRTDNTGTFLLYSVKPTEMSEEVFNVIYDLDNAVLSRGMQQRGHDGGPHGV